MDCIVINVTYIIGILYVYYIVYEWMYNVIIIAYNGYYSTNINNWKKFGKRCKENTRIGSLWFFF